MYLDNREEYLVKRKEANRQWHKQWYRKQSHEKRMWRGAKARAKKKGLDFTIEVEDIFIPDVCPVTGEPLDFSFSQSGKARWNSPSLDRVDNAKGYTKENIKVISNKANRHKGDLTTKQVENLYRYVFGLENP